MPEINLKEILEQIQYANSPLLNQALAYEWNFRKQTVLELNTLLGKIENTPKTEPEALQQSVLDKLQVDTRMIETLNPELANYRLSVSPAQNGCTYPFKYHKMSYALRGARDFVQRHFVQTFYEHTIPKAYTFSCQQSDITILGESRTSLFGNPKGTYFKTAALTTYLAANGLDQLQQACDGTHFSASWIDHSAMIHVTAMPKKLFELPSFEQFTYKFSDANTPHGFAFVHNGFTYGGHRSERQRYPNGKLFGPEDCSSFQAKITGSLCPYTTADQLFFYRAKVREEVVNPDWLKTSPEFSALDTICEPVVLKNPDQDIQPGQIYCHRKFDLSKDPNMDTTLGIGGHTGIVVGFERDGKDSNILILAADRDIENNIEGFGIQRMRLYDKGKKVMLFSTQAKTIGTTTTSTTPSMDSNNGGGKLKQSASYK